MDIKLKINSVAIIGWHDSSAGQLCTWLENSGYNVVCYINPDNKMPFIDKKNRKTKLFHYPNNNKLKGLPIISSSNWALYLRNKGIKKIIITDQFRNRHHDLLKDVNKEELEMINYVHPSAYINEGVILHKNVIVYPRAVVGYMTEINPLSVISLGAQLDHHNVISENVFVGPGVVTAGNVYIGNNSTVYTGSTIINNINIGNNVTIGAGSVVLEDVKDGATVVGIPARRIK